MNQTVVEIKIVDKELYAVKHPMTGLPVGCAPPKYATEGSAAFDLVSAENCTILPGETKMINTGICIHIINEAMAGLILPRSSLGSKGLVLGNSVGLIDSDYQGPLMIAAWNRLERETDTPFHVKRGDRIAQLVIVPVLRADWKAVEEFSIATDRGTGGFGSTGVRIS